MPDPIPHPSQDVVDLADYLLDNLTAGTNFTIPPVDFSTPEFQIPPLTPTVGSPLSEADLTTRTVNGTGMFDALMQSIKAHLTTEFEKGRIAGPQYAEAYIANTNAALGSAVQYLLSKGQAHWQTVLAERQALMAEVELVKVRISAEEAKARLALLHIQTDTARVEYALKKQQLTLGDVSHDTAVKQLETASYNLSFMLPAQVADVTKGTEVRDAELTKARYEVNSLLPAQLLSIQGETAGRAAQTAQTVYETTNLLPEQLAKLEAEGAVLAYQLTTTMPTQQAGLAIDNDTKTYNLAHLLPAQLDSLKEQTEGHRAKTLDTRTDGSTVTGAMGAQQRLYEQQITSYKRDAETKAVRMMLDTWTTQKTVDEGLTAPSSLQNNRIDLAFNKLLHNLTLVNG